ncbi:MAG TPA: alpha/beta family hydrolase [Candidatus Limnocylindrales bacterium]|nr:alpha/beta family hydrolase [Candidatus Limnocylindrales bacterium]
MQPTIYLGHGASGDAGSMQPFVDGLRARGFGAVAVDLPKRKAEEVVSVWRTAVPDGPGTAVGGHSFGGRVASLAAAERNTTYEALVLFSYPLHPPGKPENTAARIAHWPNIRCPVLLLSGEADPFAKIKLLREAVQLLSHHELVTWPGLGHGVKPVLDEALDRVAAFLREVAPGEAAPPSGPR